MRLAKFMKEDITTDALEIGEPEVGKKYSDDYVSKRVDILQKALKKIRGKAMNDDAKEAIMADLNDKLDKWENVDKETKAPEPPAVGAAPEGEEGPAEEEPAQEEEPAPDDEAAKEEEDRAKEDEEKDAEREKEEEEKEKKRVKDAEDREKRQEKAASENVRLIKTKIKRRV